MVAHGSHKPPGGISVGETNAAALEARMARLEEAINASKFLTKEKKAELIQKAKDAHNTLEDGRRSAEKKYREDIAKLLDEAIQTRVKNAEVLKQAVNTALVASGLLALRAGAYGVLSLSQRYDTVAKERKEKKRTGSQFNEWIVQGFKETAHKLVGGGANHSKMINVVRVHPMLLAVGMSDLASTNTARRRCIWHDRREPQGVEEKVLLSLRSTT